jgi:hypothetical protein
MKKIMSSENNEQACDRVSSRIANVLLLFVIASAITAGIVCFIEVAQAKLVMDISSTTTSHPLLTGMTSYWEIVALVLVGCGGVKSINKEENKNDQK